MGKRARPEGAGARWAAWIAIPLAILLVFPLSPAGAARSAPGTPSGYRTTSKRTVARGLTHYRMTGRAPQQVVDVAHLERGAALALRTVLANDTLEVDGFPPPRPGSQATSAMCRRVRCLVAVNGPMRDAATGMPVGDVVVDGEPVRSPKRSRAAYDQLLVRTEGVLQAGDLRWTGALVTSGGARAGIDGINVARRTGRVVLYTPRFGRSTETNRNGAELVLRVVSPKGPVRFDRETTVRLAGFGWGEGGARIPSDGVVLSGHGAGARELRSVWRSAGRGARAFLRLDARPDVLQSISGRPVLVRNGKPARLTGRAAARIGGRQPRTMVGWTKAGDVLLVTADGREPGRSLGMTLREAAELMIGLGAATAINLDGGGSTTFVVRGKVANRPSDRLVERAGARRLVRAVREGDDVLRPVERKVTAALAIVPKPKDALAAQAKQSAPRPGRAAPLPVVPLPPELAGALVDDPSSGDLSDYRALGARGSAAGRPAGRAAAIMLAAVLNALVARRLRRRALSRAR